MQKLLASFALATLIAAPAGAAPQTVTLAVSKMTCAACPITVKKALTAVHGVTKAEVSLEKHEVVVTFDDAKTTRKALTDATTNAGYPSTVRN